MNEEQEHSAKRVTPRLLRVTQVLVMLVTAFLFGAHVLKWDALQVDTVTLALLSFLVVIPLAELVRKIKLGEFEAEIGREEIAKVQAKAATELPPSSADAISVSEERIRSLLAEDPRLALAKVRIELEESLKRLYAANAQSEPEWRRLSLGRLVDNLIRREVLSSSLASALREVITLANRAVHGEHVESHNAEQLAVLGIRLVHEVQQLYVDRVLRPVESVVISGDEMNEYGKSRYRVTTIIPLVKNPTRNTYIFDQNALDSFLEGYEEYAEFIVSIEKLSP
ncbi:MAG: DUF4145 domain-containing protein [Nitrospirota bacterium]